MAAVKLSVAVGSAALDACSVEMSRVNTARMEPCGKQLAMLACARLQDMRTFSESSVIKA